MSDSVQASYDRVADEYTARIAGELEHKPLDRGLLDRFAEQAVGLVCDVGCGPGHIARYLHQRGANVMGVDLSSAMVEAARRLNPEIPFVQADMRSLDFENNSLGGIVAFYSIIHIPRPEVGTVLTELKRVLEPGGLLLLAFHIGEDFMHRDEWWGQPVLLDFLFFQPEAMKIALIEAGFEAVEVVEREPYPGVEHPTRRAYVFARKPRVELR